MSYFSVNLFSRDIDSINSVIDHLHYEINVEDAVVEKVGERFEETFVSSVFKFDIEELGYGEAAEDAAACAKELAHRFALRNVDVSITKH